MRALDQGQIRLVEQAQDFLEKYYIRGQHHAACALQCGSDVYFSFHLDTSGFDVCAEPTAISNALQAGESEFLSIVAVLWDGDRSERPRVISPCGECRQVILEYAPGIDVVVDGDDGLGVESIEALLPHPYLQNSRRRNRRM